MRTNTPSLAFFIAFFLVACDSEAPQSETKAETLVRPAKLIEVGQTSDNALLNYPAVIQSRQLSVLSFEVGGKLKELMVIEAQRVKKGDVLAQLDQRDLLAKLASARAQFKNANTEYQRALRLIKQDAISSSELEERKSNRDVNKSELETAEKALQDSVLVAPFSGAIAKVSIEKRQIIQPGKPAITILGKQGLEAKINLPSSILAKAGARETPATDSYLVLDAAPDRQIPVTFKEASLEADEATQTYAVTFAFDAPEGLIVLPGMNAVVWFKDPGKSSTNLSQLSVPLTAIAIDGEQKYVWVVDKDSMKVARRDVVIEAGVGVNLNITSGLEAEEMIVAAGISSLSEGMQVRPWSK
ncbi:MAG: efflux RND transporter periplasmic adaptor subunit [Gammaproteobacteria bacterium]|nr:efflux RND transporter periplasmic adaptor subunit [Gammaproteobacteria bacterium]